MVAFILSVVEKEEEGRKRERKRERDNDAPQHSAHLTMG